MLRFRIERTSLSSCRTTHLISLSERIPVMTARPPSVRRPQSHPQTNSDNTFMTAVEQEINSLTPPNPLLLPKSRRGFLQASALAGFAASVAPTGALQAQTITTSAEGLDHGMVQMGAANDQFPGYFAKPKGKRVWPPSLFFTRSSACTSTLKMSAAALPRRASWPSRPSVFIAKATPASTPPSPISLQISSARPLTSRC